MGIALDSILALKQNITGSAFEALTPGTGDSFSIKSYSPASRAWLLEVYGGNSVTKCQFRIRSPRMHDNVQGLRMAWEFNPTLSGGDGDPQMLTAPYVRQMMYSTDVLVIEVNGTANDDVDLVSLIYYEDLTGVAANLRTWEEVSNRGVNTLGLLVTPAAGTANDYGASEAINTDQATLKANTEYAILGATTDLPSTSLGIRGTDTGNLRVAMPLSWDNRRNAGWFVDLAVAYGLPLIPVFNSNNAGSTYTDLVSATNSALAPNVCLQLLELT